MDSQIVCGVTLHYIITLNRQAREKHINYSLVNNEHINLNTTEEFYRHIIKPCQAIRNLHGVSLNDQMIWGSPWGPAWSEVIIGVKGDPENLESALKTMFNLPEGIGVPAFIYKPNKVFPKNDTYEGIELAKIILESNDLVKKVKRANLIFPSEFQYVIKVKK